MQGLLDWLAALPAFALYAALYAGAGSCYVEFGAGSVGRVDVDFFSGPKPSGTFQAPSAALRVEKERFGASRQARWFGA